MLKYNFTGGLQPQDKTEMILIVLIGVFLIIILKHRFHMDDGTVKAIIEAYNFYAGYILNVFKWCINEYVLKK